MTAVRLTLELEGAVQGVGFRPALCRLAAAFGLAGAVQNRRGSVWLELAGARADIARFLGALPRELPPQARIDRVSTPSLEELPGGVADPAFRILPSASTGASRVAIPADLAVCGACLAEVRDPSSRRAGYAFTTCTDCGPRYTVIDAMPYDRERTSLAAFALCGDCEREYRDPTDRRFHAESIACPACGPQVFLIDAAGQPGPRGADAVRAARFALARGELVAVRGLGGYLIAANALDAAALAALRHRKPRPHKPLALMARSLDAARQYFELPAVAARAMASAAGPIVVLERRIDGAPGLPHALIAPDTDTIGVMLPTTPLHALLFEPRAGDPVAPFDLLVMTSGNREGEPTLTANADACARFAGIADVVLAHDREIRLRNDDSVCAVQRGELQVWRRARGYAPGPIALAAPVEGTVLAMGAELSNAIGVGFGAEVVLSPHVGDLASPDALAHLEEVADRLPAFLGRAPDLIAVDLHPDLHATRLGERLAAATGATLVRVQHHHAHAAACLAEHGGGDALALAFDGSGYGTDGSLWGAELFALRGPDAHRLASFAPAALPGGDAAIREPARQAVARLVAAGVAIDTDWCALLGVEPAVAAVWQAQIARGLNAPPSRGAGRLFDAFAAALGLAPARVSYQAQAAVRLESAARRAVDPAAAPALTPARCERGDFLELDWSPAFAALAAARPGAASAPAWALALHRAVARAAVEMASFGRSRAGLRRVALTGGVFMNRLLTDLVAEGLIAAGFVPLIHRAIPPNDGGIAVGQVVVASQRQPACV